MGHQVPVLLRAMIVADEIDALNADLATMRGDLAANKLLPFALLPATHFARFVVLPAVDEEGERIPASLVYASCVDVSVDQHLRDVVAVAGDGLDRIYGHCEGYPADGDRSAQTRIAYLQQQRLPTQTFYVNTVGRTVEQVHSEALLRRRLEEFLDQQDCRSSWREQPPEALYAAIRGFVADKEDLRWALTPASKPPLLWRLKERVRFAALIAGTAVFSPVIVPLAILGLLWFRFQEWRVARSMQVDHRLDSRTDLQLLEDHVAQNQFSAVGFVKPGVDRALIAKITLWVIDVLARHIYTNGDLGTVKFFGLHGVDTIHFARWVFIDGGRRVMFMSNYDGSFENYMDDFINKVAWGLNGSFTHGVGYPPTQFLVCGGARDEQAFKAFLRRRQVPTAVWYSAYPDLTAVNIANNAQIRAGLSSELRGPDLSRWLRRF